MWGTEAEVGRSIRYALYSTVAWLGVVVVVVVPARAPPMAEAHPTLRSHESAAQARR